MGRLLSAEDGVREKRRKKVRRRKKTLDFFEAVQGVRMSAGSAVLGSSKDCSQSIKSNSSSKNSSKNSTVPHLVQQQQNIKDPQPGTSNHSSGNCNNSESAKSESATTTESPYVIVNNAVDLNNQAGQPADDPKPGPSTTAAEFDLEVLILVPRVHLKIVGGVTKIVL